MVRAEGVQNVPRAGPVLLAARHYHHFFDAATLATVVERQLHILVALDWAHNGPERWMMEGLCRSARWPIVLRRERVAHSDSTYAAREARPILRRARTEAVELLAQGRALVVFPEAYPSIDPEGSVKTGPDEILPFQRGFAALVSAAARRHGVAAPVVPVGFHYQRGPRWVVQIRFGKPIVANRTCDPRALAAQVEALVRELSRPLSSVSGNVISSP